MRGILLILCVFVCCGCFAHAPARKLPPAPPVVTGSVVDAAGLRTGGKLGFTLFKAGPQAEANDQLDRISLMIIKGIRERVQEAGSRISLADAEADADFILGGYVERYLQPGKFQRWVMRQKKASLAVSGEVWKKGSGQKILTFAAARTMNAGATQVQDAAYGIGREIGEYLLSNAK